jgi:hypothetical protein
LSASELVSIDTISADPDKVAAATVFVYDREHLHCLVNRQG